MSKTTVKTNIDAYTGLTGLVVETIDPSTGQGRISIGGESWKARTEDNSKLEEGQQVKVVEVNGLCLIVKRIS